MSLSTNLTLAGLAIDIVGAWLLAREVRTALRVEVENHRIQEIRRLDDLKRYNRDEFHVQSLMRHNVTEADARHAVAQAKLVDSETPEGRIAWEGIKEAEREVDEYWKKKISESFDRWDKIAQPAAIAVRKKLLLLGMLLLTGGFALQFIGTLTQAR